VLARNDQQIRRPIDRFRQGVNVER
jgi:hypothetical protein